MGPRLGASQSFEEEEPMSSEPKNPPQPAEAKDNARRPYAAPRLKHLGSVRDLTLGSPTGGPMDGLPGGKRTM